jgi:hypothetical protein
MYHGRTPPQEPPCDVCRPDVKEANVDALKIYSIVRNQFIMSMETPVDINHVAIWQAIEKYGITKERDTFEKVLTLSAWDIKRLRMIA